MITRILLKRGTGSVEKQEERENEQWKQNREHGDEVTHSAWVLVR